MGYCPKVYLDLRTNFCILDGCVKGINVVDYFKELQDKLKSENSSFKILRSDVLECKIENGFELFTFGISDEVRYLYDHYKRFLLSWEEKTQKWYGFVDFISYDEIEKEHEQLCELAEEMDKDIIEKQDNVIEDLQNWYPIFRFSNGDSFCYDKRNGKIVFFEHEVFDIGVNLHGLVIAESIDTLLENWSKVLFIDIYDWFEGVNEHGIDFDRPIYKDIMKINGK